jgi:hypothetical protein
MSKERMSIGGRGENPLLQGSGFLALSFCILCVVVAVLFFCTACEKPLLLLF